MNDLKIAGELTRLADELTGEPTDNDFKKAFRDIESIRTKFDPTIDVAVFLSIVRDMALKISRGNTGKVKALAGEIVEEFGR